MDNETASKMLQVAICDVVNSTDQNKVKGATEWLHLKHNPTKEQILSPDPFSFISICRQLGLSWKQLQEALRETTSIDEHYKGLRLVHNAEPIYTVSYEKDIDRNRIGKNSES